MLRMRGSVGNVMLAPNVHAGPDFDKLVTLSHDTVFIVFAFLFLFGLARHNDPASSVL